MEELVLASYIKIMQEGFSENSKQEAAARLLLNSIVSQEVANCSTDLSSKKISNIVKRKDPVPDDIKLASSKTDVIEHVYVYFSNRVMEDLNQNLKYDTYEKILRLVENTKDIASLKKKELLSFYDSQAYDRFLAEVFLYVLGRENRKNRGSDWQPQKRILYRSSLLSEDESISLINDSGICAFSKAKCLENNEVYHLDEYFTFDSSYDDDGKRVVEAHVSIGDLYVTGDTSSENWISRSFLNNVTKTSSIFCTAWLKVLENVDGKCRVQYLVIGDEV